MQIECKDSPVSRWNIQLCRPGRVATVLSKLPATQINTKNFRFAVNSCGRLDS